MPVWSSFPKVVPAWPTDVVPKILSLTFTTSCTFWTCFFFSPPLFAHIASHPFCLFSFSLRQWFCWKSSPEGVLSYAYGHTNAESNLFVLTPCLKEGEKKRERVWERGRESRLFFSLLPSELFIFIGCLLGRPSTSGKSYFLRSIKAIPESLPDSLTWKIGFSVEAK